MELNKCQDEAKTYGTYAAMGYREGEVKRNALSRQEGGSHYKDFVIQPVEFCHVNNIPYIEATAIKYLCRWRKKNGLEDLKKAKHFIEMLIELETKDVNH